MSNHLKIRKVAVLGAGVMGAQIAAHLVNANVETLLFELPAKEGDPNGNVNKALDGLKKLDPAPISSPSRITYIQPANYEQHLEQLRECDLVIEAIAERMDWKSDLYRKVAPFVNERAIFASNTSGLSINELAAAFPDALRHRFCGIHFFNPPRYMHLVELIPCRETEASLLDELETFLVSTLGKGVVRAKDTPNFIANRIGVFSMLATKHHAAAFNLGFDMVDALTGRYLGRPKSATFRTLDVVGLDVFAHVVNTMRENLTDDPWHQHFELPSWFNYLVDQGSLGQKTKRGIYMKIGKEIHVLDLHTREYRLSDAKVDDGVKEILRERDWAKKLAGLRNSPHPQAQFLWAVFRDVFHYCALHLEIIANNARDLDFAVRWGFGWDNGPFEIWQAAGWQQVAGWISADIAAGKAMAATPLPAWATDPSRTGVHTPQGSFSPLPQAGEGQGVRGGAGSYQPRSQLPVYRRQLYPDHLLGEERHYGETVFETDEVRLWHTGDNIAILSFKTKMHTVSNEVLDGILRAVNEAEEHFSALILWQSEPPFSAGANLLQLMQGVQEGASGIRRPARQAQGRGHPRQIHRRGRRRAGRDHERRHRQRAACRSRGRQVPARVATPQIRAGAHHRRGGRPGARRRLRILHPLLAHRRHAGKLHRPGRSRRRPAARGRRLQGDDAARLAGSTTLRQRAPRGHLPLRAPLLPEHRHGRSRQERRTGKGDGLPQAVRPHRDEQIRAAAHRQGRSQGAQRHRLPSAAAHAPDTRSPAAPASPPSRPRWSTCCRAASSPSTTTTSAAASPRPCAAATWSRTAWWMSNGCSIWSGATSWNCWRPRRRRRASSIC